ncbi:MAG: serine/threonine protein phosphatase, partial [Candidatus Limiplasma sp.]|nr:serine/threonine protein phosphatase [Candidatus Limiplasma sp.]
SEEPGVRILMSHRPEDYYRYLQNAPVDLILAGHAHGGQIRIAGQGLYAPGQGILPKLTHGLVDGRMVISAGATNAVPVPRWGNPCEVLAIDLD